jgi:hypothetical protein
MEEPQRTLRDRAERALAELRHGDRKPKTADPDFEAAVLDVYVALCELEAILERWPNERDRKLLASVKALRVALDPYLTDLAA